MLKLSRRVEYGLMAVQHIAHKPPGDITTAREIAKTYDIPYELVAKVLQKLSRAGIAISIQGVNGGYTLAKPAEEIPVIAILRAIEGSEPALVPCVETGGEEVHTSCEFEKMCEIKTPMMKIQSRLVNMFSTMRVSEIM